MSKRFEGKTESLVELGAKLRWEQLKERYTEARAALKTGVGPTPPWTDEDLFAQFGAVCELAAREEVLEQNAEAGQWNEAQRELLCEKGRLQRMIDDVLTSGAPRALDFGSDDEDGAGEVDEAAVMPISFLVHGMGRLKVEFGRGLARVLLDNEPWYTTGDAHAIEIGTYDVTLQFNGGFAPAMQAVTIDINKTVTVSFT